MEIAEPSASERALNAARYALSKLAPEYSARLRLTIVQGVIGLAGLALLIEALLGARDATLLSLEIVAFVFFAVMIAFRCAAAFSALAPPKPSAVTWSAPLPVYTILCPLYREARVLRDLAARLGLDERKFVLRRAARLSRRTTGARHLVSRRRFQLRRPGASYWSLRRF